MSAVVTAWRSALATATEGLDVADAEDRATFRQRVLDLGASSRRHVLVEVLADLSADTPRASNAAVLRQIADAHLAAAGA